jgi:hypothetical protein
MAERRAIRWLHLSDLHLGCQREDLWWQVQEDLAASVRALADQLGPPDLLLLSGDLTNTGAAKQFDRVDRLLDALLGWLARSGGAEPLIVAVPGNHDLQRPLEAKMYRYAILNRYVEGGPDDPDVRGMEEALWSRRDVSVVRPLFASYQAWVRKRLLPDLQRRAKIHQSHFPGDFCLEVEIAGAFPLCLVGLNSTWQQYKGGDFERKLTLPGRQLQAALPAGENGSPLAVFHRHPRALLMLHHPPSWLSPAGCRIFDELIYPANRFDLCLCGHLHEGRSVSAAVSGGAMRTYFQAPSLFGLEHFGTRYEDRMMGYAWGSLSAEGEVQIWPLSRVNRGSGEGVFVHDYRFPEAADGVVIRPVAAPATHIVARAEPAADFRGYLAALIAQTGHINVSGISVAGSARGALRYPIERLYTPLRSRADAAGLGTSARRMAEGLVGLPDLLPRHPRLLLEGQPGAGKTTFLRFAACMLARDMLGIAGPEGRTWRECYLGLAGLKAGVGLKAAEALTPVLVRISDLLPLLTAEEGRLRHDDRRRLLDFLAVQCRENEVAVDREEWRRLLEGGRGLLLLDGLDEVADEGLRGRIFDIFRDAYAHWGCPMVVTSRPIRTAELREMGFHVAAVEPFGRVEIETFLDRWVSALYQAEDAAALRGEGDQYRKALLAAICDLPRVRRLASNPVMLTCLCVVHWNEGHLPQGRSRVYRAVLRWLIAARTRLREGAGFMDRFAWSALAQLALAMMAGKQGKRTTFDLEESAVAVDAAVRRLFPALTPEERRMEARRWLRFECLGSGILEELPGRRLRFWHLTFQEFLAALQLAWRDDGEDQRKAWWPLVREHLDAAQWRETIELFPGCLLDEGGEGRVDRLLERVLGLRGGDPDLASEALVAGIVGRLLATLVAEQYEPQPEIRKVYEQALQKSLGIFTVAGAAKVPVEVRIAAAEALGRGGDPRLAPERDNFLPVSGFPGVRLGKYPVTVEEYQRFVESRGYEERKHWEAEGWDLKEKQGWTAPRDWEDQLATPNRPVIGVSWLEASAYCCWLSEQRGESVRLPAEVESEKAATPAAGAYPWGEDRPNRERANFAENIGAPTPVGIYPAGDGPDGHCDLVGNVWEWCADESGGGRSLRGGCWDIPAGFLRAAVRGGGPAWYGSDRIGFRVAAGPASA